MAKKFVKNWSRGTKRSLIDRIRRKKRLREKVTGTIYRLNSTQKRLNDFSSRLEQRDKSLFDKCVRAQGAKDSETAAMYANECAQIKRTAQMITQNQLALNHVALRLETVKSFGDAAIEVIPAAAVARSVKGRLAGVIPEVSMKLEMIDEALDMLVTEMGEATGQAWRVMASGGEAEKILREANSVAEQKTKERFPALPTMAAP